MPINKKGIPGMYKKESNRLLIAVVSVLIVAIVLIIAGLAIMLGTGTPPVVNPPTNITNNGTVIVNQTNITNITKCDDNCLVQLAETKKDASICTNITNSTKLEECYERLANFSLDTCIKIKNYTVMKSCITYHAVKINSTEVCVNLKAEDAQKCRLTVDQCYYATGTDETTCKALQAKDYSICKKNEDCIYNYSMTTGDINACGELADAPKQFACIAVTKKSDECAKLSLQAQKDLCREIYAKKMNNNMLCTLVLSDTTYALGCYSHFAVSDRDLSICDIGLSLDNRWKCYQNYSWGTGDRGGCDNITKWAPTNRFICYFEYAKKFGDPSACEAINDTTMESLSCYIGSITNNSNLKLENCHKMRPTVWKNSCYTEVGILKNDTSTCDYITTYAEKQSCIANVKES